MRKLKEDLNDLKQNDPKSKSAQDAKSKNLNYVGFDRYEDPESQQITHVAQNDKLVPYKTAVKTNTFQTQNSDDISTYSEIMSPEIEELHNKLMSYYSPEKYDQNQINALTLFSQTGYFDINNKLSAIPADVPANMIEPTDMSDTLGDTIMSLDSALKKSRAPLDFLVYTRLAPDLDIFSITPGTSFKFKGFRSTSISLQTVINSAQSDQSSASGRPTIALLQIKIRKNSKGMYIANYSQTPEEGEFLLPRGAKIQILDGPSKLVASDATSDTMNLEIMYFDCVLKS